MAALSKVTFTGVDENTDLARLCDLSQAHPASEWGLLYSPKRAGLPGRYPSVPFLQQTLRDLPANVNVALHVCGAGVQGFLSGERVISGLVTAVARRGGRVQLNFNQANNPLDLWDLFRAIALASPLKIITQHNDANEGVAQALSGCPNHSLLFDASGGRGELAGSWPTPLPGVSCGYAGGLGPSSIHAQLPRILEASAACALPTWIDMESNVRSTGHDGVDWLDLGRCKAVLNAVDAVMSPRVSCSLAM